MIHLDSSFLIDALIPGSPQESQLLNWIGAGTSVGISSLAWGEFLCGPLPSAAAESLARTLFPTPEPLQALDAEMAARLFNLTGRRSRSFADCCIAAVALRVGAQLATSNTTDFQPFVVHGLIVA
jgi:predicted nucleic acid-binding protein